MIIVSEIKSDIPKGMCILKYGDEYEVFDKSGNSIYYVDEHNSTIENVVKDIFAYLNGKL